MSGAATDGLIWATRGRHWGFRFLLKGGIPDPLATYERVFAALADERAGWNSVGDAVGLRFPDPLARRDAAGRVIPHDFVILGEAAAGVESVDDGLHRVWPLVAGAYPRVWDASGPPSAADLFPG